MTRRNGLKPRTQPRDGLRSKRDLRNEKNDATARFQRRVDGAQVYLGLARAGDAVKQRYVEFFVGETNVERGHGGSLLAVKRMRLRGDEFAVGKIVGVGDAFDATGLLADNAAFEERGDDRGGLAESGEHQRFIQRAKLLGEKRVKFRLLRSALGQRSHFVERERADDEEQLFLLDRRAIAHRGGQHRLDDAIETAGVITCHPARELEEVGGQRRKRVHDLPE